jgi:ABC-type enterochelin transport system permease subunit
LSGSTALVGPRLFFSFLIYSIHNRQGSLNE